MTSDLPALSSSFIAKPLVDGSSASIDHRQFGLDRFGSNFDEQVRVISKLVIIHAAAAWI